MYAVIMWVHIVRGLVHIANGVRRDRTSRHLVAGLRTGLRHTGVN